MKKAYKNNRVFPLPANTKEDSLKSPYHMHQVCMEENCAEMETCLACGLSIYQEDKTRGGVQYEHDE